MILKEKHLRGIDFCLRDNPFYKRNEWECKYQVMYFSDLYGCWCNLYHCDYKRDFNERNIIAHW